MPFGKSLEEKAAERAEKEQRAAEEARRQAEQHAAAEKERQRAAFRASAVGQATIAKEEGQGFFEVQLIVGSSQRSTSIFDAAGTTSGVRKAMNHAGTLARIEAAGWRLEHVGYVFMITGESSHERIFSSGENTAVSGQMVGIYLFRNVDPA